MIVNGVVYALAYNGNLTALDLRSGQILWKREIGGVKDLIVDAGRIYLVDQDDRVIALNADGGVAIWRQSDLLHRNLTSPVLFNGYRWLPIAKATCTGSTPLTAASWRSRNWTATASRPSRSWPVTSC